MSDADGSIKPEIDDAFWFKLSGNLVTEAQTVRNDSAAKLQTFALWLWGIYTGSAAIGFTLAGKSLSLLVKILIIAPSVVLIAVYCTTVWVLMPVFEMEFDPRSPTQIKRVYENFIGEKTRRLKYALGMAVVAALLVALALVTASLSKEQKVTPPAPPPAHYTFAAAIHTKDDKRTLALTGRVGQTTKVILDLQPIPLSGKNPQPLSMPIRPEDGLLQTSIPLGAMTPPLTLSLEWEDPTGLKIKLSRTLKESETKVETKARKQKKAN